MAMNSGAQVFSEIARAGHWFEQVDIRYCRQMELPDLEWEGEYAKFRRVYANVFERTRRNNAVMWVAALPSVGIIGQGLVQLDIVGQKQLADGVERAYFHSFRIRSQFRNAGLGIQMMDVVETDLLRRGFLYLSLNVVAENTGALRLYKRLGYEIIGPDPGKWSYVDHQGFRQDVHEPGWRMRKRLDASSSA